MASQYASKPKQVSRPKAKTAPQVAEEAAHRADQVSRDLVISASLATEALAADDRYENKLLINAPIFTSQRDARRQQLLRQLAGASRGLVAAYQALLEERQVWERLARQDVDTHPLGLRGQVLLLEAAQHDIGPILEKLKYEGPPSPEEWVERIQQPLRILSHGVAPGQAIGLAADAEHSLRELVGRLDRLVGTTDQANELDPSPDLVRWLKTRLRGLLSAARDQVAPALVIAFFSTSAGVAGMGDPTAVVSAGGTAVLSRGAELGALAWMAHRRTPTGASARADLQSGIKTLYDCIKLAGDPPRYDYSSLLIRRSAMQIVLDSTRLKDGADDERWWDWAKQVETVLADPDFAEGTAMELCHSVHLLVKVPD